MQVRPDRETGHNIILPPPIHRSFFTQPTIDQRLGTYYNYKGFEAVIINLLSTTALLNKHLLPLLPITRPLEKMTCEGSLTNDGDDAGEELHSINYV